MDFASIKHEFAKTEVKQRIAQLQKELFAYLFAVAQGAPPDSATELRLRHDIAEAKELKYSLVRKLQEIDLCMDCISEEHPTVIQAAAPRLQGLKSQLVTEELIRSCLG